MTEVIKRNTKEVVLSALVRTSEQAPFYLFTAFVIEFATGDLGFGQNFVLYLVMGAAPLIGAWLLHSFGVYAISVYIVVTAVVTLVATALLPERSKADQGSLAAGRVSASSRSPAVGDPGPT